MTSTTSGGSGDPFDFVIVGGGSAGCVLAHQLSADSAARVALVEAGPPDSSPLLANPSAWPALIGGEFDSGYTTVPQADADSRCIYWPRGRVLGGSSSINAMVFMRGARADYDSWAAHGCVGWDWDSVAPYFQALETTQVEGPTRGRTGRLHVTVPETVSPLSEAVHEAAVQLGFAELTDPNHDLTPGVGRNQLTVTGGRRHSAATAFLGPVLGRENLTVLTDTRATRLIVELDHVVAVEVRSPEGRHRLPVSGEVVLSAGTIESPKLLLLSGVGPAEELRRLDLPVHVDSPNVGKNLHDHPGVPVTFATGRPVPVGPNQASETFIFADSHAPTTGPATHAVPPRDSVDLQYGALTVPLDMRGQVADFDGFTFYPSALKPASRGTVELASADASAPPRIDPAYLRESHDVAVLREAVAISRELAVTPALAAWVDREVWPGPAVASQGDVDAYIRAAVNTWYHPVGTCRMGSDPESVVDPKLRVRGLANVSVVDASVFPEITSGNTNAPTLMTALRASAWLTGQRH